MKKLCFILLMIFSSSQTFASLETITCNGSSHFEEGKNEVFINLQVEVGETLKLNSYTYAKKYYLYALSKNEPVSFIHPHERIYDWDREAWDVQDSGNKRTVTLTSPFRKEVIEKLEFNLATGKGKLESAYFEVSTQTYSMNCDI